jgi:hypothetical protein
MAVTVDIPGIGKVQAEDAASEATLKKILDALKKGAKGGGSGGGAGGAGGPGGGMEGVLNKTSNKLGKFGDEIQNTTSVLGDFGRGLSMMTGMVTKGLGMVTDTAMGLATEFLGTSVKMSDFASHLPLVGGALSSILGMVEENVQTFRSLSEVGASFGNNIVEMNLAAADAGLSMEQFAEFVGSNAQNMMLLGGTTTEGAKAFGRLTKSLPREELMGMGFTMESLAEHTSSYIELQAMQGKLAGRSQASLRAGSEQYLMQIDRLAKVTGKSRKEAEALLKKQASEANVMVMASRLSGEALTNFQDGLAFVDSELPGFSGAIKDLADGVAQTPLAQKLAATIPGFAELQKQLGDGAISQEEYIKQMAGFGPEMDAFIKSMDPAMVQSLMGKEGFEGLTSGLAEYKKMSAKYTDADIAAMKAEQQERDKTTKTTAAFEVAMTEMRNKIKTTILDSGLFDMFMEGIGTFTEWFTSTGKDGVSKLDGFLDGILKYGEEMAKFLKDTWEAAGGDLGKFFSEVWDKKFKPMIKKGFDKVGEIFGAWFGAFFKEHIGTLIVGVLGGLAGLLLTGFITSLLPTIFGIILGPIIAPFLAIGVALLAIFGWEKIKSWVQPILDVFSTMFEFIGKIFTGLVDKLKKLNPFSWFGGDDEEDDPNQKIAENLKKTEIEDPKIKIANAGVMPDYEMPTVTTPEIDTTKIVADSGVTKKLQESEAAVNTNSTDLATATLVEQNKILKQILRATNGLQGNMLKGTA